MPRIWNLIKFNYSSPSLSWATFNFPSCWSSLSLWLTVVSSQSGESWEVEEGEEVFPGLQSRYSLTLWQVMTCPSSTTTTDNTLPPPSLALTTTWRSSPNMQEVTQSNSLVCQPVAQCLTFLFSRSHSDRLATLPFLHLNFNLRTSEVTWCSLTNWLPRINQHDPNNSKLFFAIYIYLVDICATFKQFWSDFLVWLGWLENVMTAGLCCVCAGCWWMVVSGRHPPSN